MTKQHLVTAASALRTAATAVAAVAIFCGQASAVNDIIAQWNFQSGSGNPPSVMNSTDITGLGASAGTGTAAGHHASSATDWTSPAGNGSANSLTSNNWAMGDYMQFEISTAGLTDIGLSFASTSSGTGPRDFRIEYATSSGGPYTYTGVSYINLTNASPIAWNPDSAIHHPGHDKSVDLTSIGALDGQTSLVIRLVQSSAATANGGPPAPAATSRIGNVTLYSNFVPIVNGDYNDNKIVDAADYVLWRKDVTPLTNEVPGITPSDTTDQDYAK